ncbi:murein biosynthesis integral membrane protein MurJ [Viridibacillus sp. FSL R5-0477]|uniref:murein biosynthesis integral membrane protein MurJ n=1 Tax=unclassified Viridibacillus TaxID=2617942 RepID=UPI000685E75A|nr:MULTISPECIES: murein biosynthesis integral membrane protein MurJ [Viridibacillus]OMC80995.1 lipid II flippase MurJ [Viridibacillus sp. FSL H8-0123]OMC89347.1 lipid II flippase MurJ [Viridibacillus arenosi]
MKKTAVLLMVITILSKVTGFLRDITLSYFYGATSTSDAYIISITITSVLFSLIISGISTAYIPMFKRIEHSEGQRSATYFTNNLINIVLIVTTAVIVIGLLFSDVLVKLFALGFDGETLRIAVLFTRIGLVGIYFTSVTQIFSGYLQLYGKFTVPAMVGLPFNFIIIISIIVSTQTNIIALAIGSVLAAFIQLIFLFPSLKKTNYRYVPIVQFNDEKIKKMAVIVFPIMIGISIDQINLMVDKTLASTLVEGGVSALTYASRLNDFVQGIFVLSFVTVMFPLISKMAVQKNKEDFKQSISEVISVVILIVVPASVGIMILAEPIIRLLFGHGHFDERAIEMTTHALFFYSIGMIGYGIREILNRTFYSLQDTKTPMYNASMAVILNIILSIILSYFMGISGIALATSISALFCSTLLVIKLRKKIGAFGLKGNFITFMKVTFASSVMGGGVYIFNNYILTDWNVFLKMSVVILIGSSIYFLLITLLKVKESKLLVNFLVDKIRPKQT